MKIAFSNYITVIAPADYVNTVRSLTFGPGVSTLQVTVDVKDDRLLEINETFFGNLRPLTNFGRVLLQPSRAMATIVDDDGKCLKGKTLQ